MPPMTRPQWRRRESRFWLVSVKWLTSSYRSVLTNVRVSVQDWPFDDGGPPPTQIVDDWLKLLNTKFREEPGSCVAVHCVAGLGR